MLRALKWPANAEHRLALGVALSGIVHLTLLVPGAPYAPARPVAATPRLDAQLVVIEAGRRDEPASVETGTALATPARVPETAATAPAAPPAEVAVRYHTAGEVDVRATQINDIALVYPQEAYMARRAGTVIAQLFISELGVVDAVSIVSATPPGIFEDAALTAAHQLRFSPAQREGRRVKAVKTIEVRFDPYESISIP